MNVRHLALAAPVALLPAAPGTAQSVAEIDALWRAMEDRCRLLFDEPAAFLASLTPERNFGVDPMAATPDGTAIYARQVYDGIEEFTSITTFEDARGLSCAVTASVNFEEVDFTTINDEWNAVFLEFLATRPDLDVTGGALDWHRVMEAGAGGMGSDLTTYEYLVMFDWGDGRRRASVGIDGVFMLSVVDERSLDDTPLDLAPAVASDTASDDTADATPGVPTDEVQAAANNLALAVDLCLQHTRDRDPVAAMEAAGFTLTPSDEATVNFEAFGVSGYLAPLTLTEWCWVESDRLSFADVQAQVFATATARFGDAVSGPATRGTLANNCPSIGVMIANRITTLEFRNVPFWEGCDSPDTGGVFFN